MISFVLIVNKQCQTRFARYYTTSPPTNQQQFEYDLGKKCVTRPQRHCLLFDFGGYNIVFRVYASLYVIVGHSPTDQENEFGILEWIQLFVGKTRGIMLHTGTDFMILPETMDTYFDKVTELDIVFQLEKVHMIMEELLPRGIMVESNQERILAPLQLG